MLGNVYLLRANRNLKIQRLLYSEMRLLTAVKVCSKAQLKRLQKEIWSSIERWTIKKTRRPKTQQETDWKNLEWIYYAL